ncbi:hypothetical protein [Actinocorallia sp. A-T 12471]|uniref:hypothetical protein n=1 Tax=Actinocorallia sp. A-T 12471 TaxID=3089813 RepID=UPI0029CB639B|nr:hypothetical protein [Actinocorallia sp. A-T 12471]MDX6743389.1 hypothetical protein [Actinocorallia sp. A-T 12471]
MATDPYETRSDTPLPRQGTPTPEPAEPDKTVPAPLPAPPASDESPAPETSFDVQVSPPANDPPPATSFDVPVAGSPKPPQGSSQPPAQPGQFVLPPDSPYAQPAGSYGSQPPAPQGQSLYETRQDPPQQGAQQSVQQFPLPPQQGYPPQGHHPQGAQPPGPAQHPQGPPPQQPPGQQPYQAQYAPQGQQPYPQQPYPQQYGVPQQQGVQEPQAKPVPPSWHRQHYAIGLFLIVFGIINLALGFLGFADREKEIAEYLSDGIAAPVLIAVKVAQAVLLGVAVMAVVRRRSVLFLPALLAWTGGFAVLTVLDLVSGTFTTLIEHLIYTAAFAAALFLSYALSVKAGTTATTATPNPATPTPQSLSRTQEFALNTLNRLHR